MVTGWARMRSMALALALAGTGISVLPAAAQAQDEEARLRKIEAEVRALQRTVFPGGDGRFFTPEVLTPETRTESGAGVPSTSAVTDILGRLDSMESQLARLTAQSEINTNAVAELSARVEAIEAARAEAVAEQVAAEEAAAAEPAPPSPERLAAVREIAKPDSGDAGDDEYVYGFRLWEAQFYPEAQQQLRLFVDSYPDHWRTSYGRNLLGRAYLDDGKPREAAPWFLQNYQTDQDGVRAADSLLYLAEAMILIGDTNRACIALAEFGESYPALASGRLQAQYEANRAKVTCS